MLDLKEYLGLLRVWNGLMWGLGVDPLREGQPLEGMWLSDLVARWPPALRALFIGLTRNGLAGLPEEIPLSGYVAFLRFYTLLRRDAWAFSYLPADCGTCLAEPLAARVQALGGRLEMGARVTGLEQQGEAWRVHWQRGEAEAGQVEARRVVLATDAPNTEAILRAGPEPALAGGDLYWPRGMATAVIRLWFDREPRAGAEAGMLTGDLVPTTFSGCTASRTRLCAGTAPPAAAPSRSTSTARPRSWPSPTPSCWPRPSPTFRASFPSCAGTDPSRSAAQPAGPYPAQRRACRPPPGRRDPLAGPVLLRRLGAPPLARILYGAGVRHRHRGGQRRPPRPRSAGLAPARPASTRAVGRLDRVADAARPPVAAPPAAGAPSRTLALPAGGSL